MRTDVKEKLRSVLEQAKRTHAYLTKPMIVQILKGSPFEHTPWEAFYTYPVAEQFKWYPEMLAHYMHLLEAPDDVIEHIRKGECHNGNPIAYGYRQVIFHMEIDHLRGNLQSLQYYIDESPYYMASCEDAAELVYYASHRYPSISPTTLQSQIIEFAQSQPDLNFIHLVQISWDPVVVPKIQNLIASTQRKYHVEELRAFVQSEFMTLEQIWPTLKDCPITGIMNIHEDDPEAFANAFLRHPFTHALGEKLILENTLLFEEKIPATLERFWIHHAKILMQKYIDKMTPDPYDRTDHKNTTYIPLLSLGLLHALDQYPENHVLTDEQNKRINHALSYIHVLPNIWKHLDHMHVHAIEKMRTAFPFYTNTIFHKSRDPIPPVHEWSNTMHQIMLKHYRLFWSATAFFQRPDATFTEEMYHHICKKFDYRKRSTNRHFDNPLYLALCEYQNIDPKELQNTIERMQRADIWSLDILEQLLSTSNHRISPLDIPPEMDLDSSDPRPL